MLIVNYPSVSNTLGALSVGSVFVDTAGGGVEGIHCRKVTVSGQTPTSGSAFALKLDDSMAVVELLNSLELPLSHSCGGDMRLQVFWDHDTSVEIPDPSTTVGALSVGNLFVYDGSLWVMVDGGALTPPANEKWVMVFNGTGVTSLADATAVTRVYGRISSLTPC